ncbi:apolipoprotein D-like [Pollicipes pollicipes]|uniref:apolipoprotein D-like n=1 Tax=Pollicipes pollicipes TaxID=41117 RepID=UPI001884C39B|nr:apolipoprotein D-like [Pollicipes pollicipes]
MQRVTILLSAVVASALAKCPNLPALEEFDSTQYTGLWYEIARYPLIGELGETCAQANYTLQGDGSIRLENRRKQEQKTKDDSTEEETGHKKQQSASETKPSKVATAGKKKALSSEDKASKEAAKSTKD